MKKWINQTNNLKLEIMKKLAAVIVCVLFNGFIAISQKNEWRDRPEIQVFLLKIDSHK